MTIQRATLIVGNVLRFSLESKYEHYVKLMKQYFSTTIIDYDELDRAADLESGVVAEARLT